MSITKQNMALQNGWSQAVTARPRDTGQGATGSAEFAAWLQAYSRRLEQACEWAKSFGLEQVNDTQSE